MRWRWWTLRQNRRRHLYIVYLAASPSIGVAERCLRSRFLMRSLLCFQARIVSTSCCATRRPWSGERQLEIADRVWRALGALRLTADR